MIQDIQPVYKWIVDSVITKARPDFLQDGVDEKILDDLKARWEAKLVASGVFNAEDGDLDDDDGPDGRASASASARADPNMDEGAAEGDPGHAEASTSAGGQAMKRKGVSPSAAAVVKRIKGAMQNAAAGAIPQTDGPGDADMSAEGAAGAGAGSSGRAADDTAGKDDVGEEISNHDSEEEEEQEDIRNLVLAQYEKVARTKSRWKCQMKQGVVHIDGREYVFAKALGEFQF